MGDTSDEARAMLAEATELYLEEMTQSRDTADVRIERISLAGVNVDEFLNAL